MANRPKKGGGGSSSGGGGGFLQGLFGPQANADFGKEQGEADFQNPTPVEQPYQSPSLWQRFLAPEQSRAAEAANIGAVRDNMLLTKDQAFRVAQREAEEKAALNRAITLENLRAQNIAAADETRRLNEETFNREVFDRARTAKLSDEERAKQELQEKNFGEAYQLVEGLKTAGGIPESVKIPEGFRSREEDLNLANAIRLARGTNANQGSDVYRGLVAKQTSENLNDAAKANSMLPLQGKFAETDLLTKQRTAQHLGFFTQPGVFLGLDNKPTASVLPPARMLGETPATPVFDKDGKLVGISPAQKTSKDLPAVVDDLLMGSPVGKKPVSRISLDTPPPPAPPMEVLSKENNALPLPRRKLFPNLDPNSLLPSRVTTKSEPFQTRQFQTILTPEEEAQRMLMLKSFLTK